MTVASSSAHDADAPYLHTIGDTTLTVSSATRWRSGRLVPDPGVSVIRCYRCGTEARVSNRSRRLMRATFSAMKRHGCIEPDAWTPGLLRGPGGDAA